MLLIMAIASMNAVSIRDLTQQTEDVYPARQTNTKAVTVYATYAVMLSLDATHADITNSTSMFTATLAQLFLISTDLLSILKTTNVALTILTHQMLTNQTIATSRTLIKDKTLSVLTFLVLQIKFGILTMAVSPTLPQFH